MRTETFKRLSDDAAHERLMQYADRLAHAHEKLDPARTPTVVYTSAESTGQGDLLFAAKSQYFPDYAQKVWSFADNPAKLQCAIPGLTKFRVEMRDGRIFKGARVFELHDMGLSSNKYEGAVYHFDNEGMRWGMTNHPVSNYNQLDVPHDNAVIVTPYQSGALYTQAMMYAATGMSPFLRSERKVEFAKAFGGLALDAAVNRVAELLERRVVVKDLPPL